MERWHGTVPLHRLDVPVPHVLPFAIGSFDSIGALSRSAFPHRHTFYEIVHITGGRGAHVLDMCGRPLDPPQLTVVTPGQVHFWENAHELQGQVVLFDDAFLLNEPGERDAVQLLRRVAEQPLLPLTDHASADIAALLTRMGREYREQRPGVVSVLRAYLHVLIVLADRSAAAPAHPADPADPAAPATPAAPADPATPTGGRAAVSERFTRLLARPDAAAERSVRTWAAELGVSISYLTEAVKEHTGRTPGQLIRQAQVLEAKRLLAGTSLTVSRVAREVGFADAAYFCRFFRREAGTTPGEFRRHAGGYHHSDRDLSIDPDNPPS